MRGAGGGSGLDFLHCRRWAGHACRWHARLQNQTALHPEQRWGGLGELQWWQRRLGAEGGGTSSLRRRRDRKYADARIAKDVQTKIWWFENVGMGIQRA